MIIMLSERTFINKQNTRIIIECTNLMRPTRGSFDTDLFSNKIEKDDQWKESD